LAADPPSTYTGSELYNAVKVLTGTMQDNPVWNALGQAVTEVMNHQVEEPRRRLARLRDPVKYRKDETISDFPYTSGTVTDNQGNVITVAPGTTLPICTIIEVIQNTGTINNPGQDYMVVQFEAGGKTMQWTAPIAALQERSTLVQQATMLGFDFFNSSLSDDDYHRVITYISQYYPYAGTEQFVRFIGFIKNIKLKSNALWSYDDGSDTFPVLEKLPNGAVPATKGGPWYLTSHVELEYDPFVDGQLPNQTILNESGYLEIETLFNFFAPIILVLERIVIAIQLNVDFFLALAGQELQIYEGKTGLDTDMIIYKYKLAAGQALTIEQGSVVYTTPVLELPIGTMLDWQPNSLYQATVSSLNVLLNTYNKQTASYPFVQGFLVAQAQQSKSVLQAVEKYKWPALQAQITGGYAGSLKQGYYSKVAYDYTDDGDTLHGLAIIGSHTDTFSSAVTQKEYMSDTIEHATLAAGCYSLTLQARAVSNVSL
jgi:hypothetical protein